MGFLSDPQRTRTRYLVELPHGVDECGYVMDLAEALPPVLRGRALVHRLSRIDGPELRDWHDAAGR